VRFLDKKNSYMVCPACGRESNFLTLCDSCEWEDFEENEKYQKLFNEVRPYAGNNAYLGHGCMVCPECEENFHWKMDYCPVQVFYRYGINRLLFLEPVIKGPEHPLNKLINYWTEHSKSQDVLEYRAKIFKEALKEFKTLLR